MLIYYYYLLLFRYTCSHEPLRPGLNNCEQILFSKVMVVEVIFLGNMDLWFDRYFSPNYIVFLDKLLLFQG